MASMLTDPYPTPLEAEGAPARPPRVRSPEVTADGQSVIVVARCVLEQHVRELQHKQQTLALHEERLATQLEAFEARVKLIAASYSAAEAQVRIGDAFDGVSTEMSDLSRALAQVEQQAEHLQLRAAGVEDTVEDALIEAEINALRQQLGV